MEARSPEQVAGALTASMDELLGSERDLALAAYRLLARGAPVPPADLAAAAGVGAAEAESWLDGLPGVFRDGEGRVIGFWGLAVGEMPHRFRVAGTDLFAWCAWDTLFMPALIGAEAGVESTCRQTGEEITFSVDADGVRDLSHPGAMVSMLAPADGLDADVMTAFCHHVHFFASPEAGDRWLAEREEDDAFLLTVDEAHLVGRLWNEHRFGEAVGA